MRPVAYRVVNFWIVVGIVLLCGVRPAKAAATDIKVPGAESTDVFGINNAGLMVGSFSETTTTGRTITHGFVTDGVTFTQVDVPGAQSTRVHDINNLGQTVGLFVSTDGLRSYGFFYDGTTFTAIDVPGAVSTEAWGVNDAGQIVGIYTSSETGHSNAFIKTGDTLTTFMVPGSTDTVVSKINDSGQVAGAFSPGTDAQGSTGFITTDETTFTYVNVPGARITAATSINASGDTTGFYDDGLSGLRHGFVWTAARFMTLDADPPTLWSQDINDSGTVVGWHGAASGIGDTGFLFLSPYNQSPKTSARVSGTVLTKAGWYVTPMTWTLTATDPNGDLAATFYSVDGQGPHLYVAPFTVFSDGVHTVSFWSVDLAGDEERHQSFSDKIDSTPPLFSVAANPSTLFPTNGRNVPVNISGSAVDTTSGLSVSSGTFQVSDDYNAVQPSGAFQVQADGTFLFTVTLQASRRAETLDDRHYRITVAIRDRAGNVRSTQVVVTVPHDAGISR